MKKFVLSLGIACMSLVGYSQNIPAPEFKDKVLFVAANNTLADLDKTELESTYSASPFTGTAKAGIKAKGPKAAITHTGSPSEVYVVKIEPGIDPETVVELMKFDESKKSRSIEMGKMVMGKSKDSDVDKFKLTFKKVSDGVYAISTAVQLEEGEYVFIVNRPRVDVVGSAMSKQTFYGFCFGVKK